MVTTPISEAIPTRPLSCEPAFIFLSLVLILFPLAHLPVFKGIPLYWSEAMLGISLLVLFLQAPSQALQGFIRLFHEERPFFVFAGLFLLGVSLAWFINPHTLSGLGEIKSFYVIPVLFSFILLFQAESRERFEWLISAWFTGIALAALAALIALGSGWLSYDGRLAGPYSSPNYLAMLLAPGLLLGGYLFSVQTDSSRRAFIFLSSLVILIALGATHSYAAFGGLLAAAGIGLWLLKPSFHRTWIVILLLLSVAGIFFLQEHGTEKWESFVSGSERSSLASRLMIWQAGKKIATDSFPWGIGTGRFQEAYLAEQINFPPYLEWAVPTPHNLYLHFLLEGGVLALIGWLGCIGIILYRARQAFVGRISPMLILGLSLMAFYLVYGLVDTPYMKNDLALAVWGSLGLTLQALRIRA